MLVYLLAEEYYLIPMINEVLSSPGAVDLIAVDIGPGSSRRGRLWGGDLHLDRKSERGHHQSSAGNIFAEFDFITGSLQLL